MNKSKKSVASSAAELMEKTSQCVESVFPDNDNFGKGRTDVLKNLAAIFSNVTDIVRMFSDFASSPSADDKTLEMLRNLTSEYKTHSSGLKRDSRKFINSVAKKKPI